MTYRIQSSPGIEDIARIEKRLVVTVEDHTLEFDFGTGEVVDSQDIKDPLGFIIDIVERHNQFRRGDEVTKMNFAYRRVSGLLQQYGASPCHSRIIANDLIFSATLDNSLVSGIRYGFKANASIGISSIYSSKQV